MYILRNACKNLMRNKGRNFLILLISLLTLVSVILSFSIRTLSDRAIEHYKDSFGVLAGITVDWEKLNREHPPTETINEDGSFTSEQSFEIPEPSMEDYARYADSEYVKKALYHASCAFYSDSLKPVPDNLGYGEEIIDISGMSVEELMKFFGASTEKELEEFLGGKEEVEKIMNTKRGCIGTISGVTDLSLLEDFKEGKRKLEEGSFPQQKNECIISTAFAEQNNLKVGDEISISGPNKADTDEISLKITGIYADYFSQVTAAELGMVYGEVFVTYDTLMDSGFHDIYFTNAAFVLNDPEAAEAFEEELYNKGLSAFYTLSYIAEEYEEQTKPLENISHIAEIFTLSASIVGAAILLLLSLINVRERKYEIGVLRAMGMKKTDVARGLIYEILFMMLAAFAFSFLLGFFLTKPVAVLLLGNLTENTFSLPFNAVLFSAFMAFALSVLSGICAVFAVMRHEPMKIFSERG